ncbi:hypothetical protein LMG26842_02588 [Achromobacter dolens]|uniref:hypothetical protein n=1 Tax=Achromobacter dolens TaxID=1287738 RepID=UPI0014675941|nr:hypothetical protein [Achromobacter dolens]CAB3846076.1 hypothetical protein LMG26842_02588 [Achromobacter dolens]
MTANPFIKPGNRLTILLVTIFAAVALLLTRVDWLTLGLGRYFPAYWAAMLLWLACVVLVLRRQRRWWVLVTAPVVLYPAVMVGHFLIECSRKACIF